MGIGRRRAFESADYSGWRIGEDSTTAADTPRSATRRQLPTLQPSPIHDRLSLTAHLSHVAYCGRPVGR
jgi:hypothetical protein